MLRPSEITQRRERACGGGFSLIEMAIVLLIMGIAAGGAIPMYAKQVQRHRAQATKQELDTIKRALVDYYADNLRFPDPDKGNILPAALLRLPQSTTTDEIYAGSHYVYVQTTDGKPFTELLVDGASIGRSAAVLYSRGRNLIGDGANKDPSLGRFVQTSTDPAFDDVVVTIAESEVRAVTAWRREITEDAAVLNAAALLIADNDDDADGLVDEDANPPPGSTPQGPQDPAGNADGVRDWTLLDARGADALAASGRVAFAHHLVDAWGNRYRWDKVNHRVYSYGPNGVDNGGSGDDIVP